MARPGKAAETLQLVSLVRDLFFDFSFCCAGLGISLDREKDMWVLLPDGFCSDKSIYWTVGADVWRQGI